MTGQRGKGTAREKRLRKENAVAKQAMQWLKALVGATLAIGGNDHDSLALGRRERLKGAENGKADAAVAAVNLLFCRVQLPAASHTNWRPMLAIATFTPTAGMWREDAHAFIVSKKEGRGKEGRGVYGELVMKLI